MTHCRQSILFEATAYEGIAEVIRIDEKRFPAAVAQGGGTGTGALGFAFREEPSAGGDLGIGEELAGQSDHALDKIRLNQGAADVALAAGIRTPRAIRREVVEHVLDPGEVNIPRRRRAVFAARVGLQLAVPPFVDVEGQIYPPVGTICGVASRE